MSKNSIFLVPSRALFFTASFIIVTGLILHFTRYEPPEAPPPDLAEMFQALEATDFHNAVIPPLTPPPDWEQYTLKSGDRLSSLWAQEWHLPVQTLYSLLQTEGGKQLNKLQPGQDIEWLASRDGQLLALRVWNTRAAANEWLREDEGFIFQELSSAKEVKLIRLSGTLNGFLASSLKEMPEIAGHEGVIATALDRHLPLRRDARDGDTFNLLIEQEWLTQDEKPYSTRLLAFDYNGQRMQVRAARYEDGRFYTPEGLSLIPPFDRIPLANRARISSSFNLYRKHPITKRVAPHYGTDFAVPTGTQVLAPADGRVIKRAWHPLAGNYLVLAHGQGFETRYLHLHRSTVKVGQDIKRGQQIALSGNTGGSTGPHLHYELYINGRPVDAMRATLPSVEKLAKQDLAKFLEQSQQYFAGLDGEIKLEDLALLLPSQELDE